MNRRLASPFAVLLALCAAILLSAFQRPNERVAPPPTCYGPACEPNGECNFITEMGTCISLCPCAWVKGKPPTKSACPSK